VPIILKEVLSRRMRDTLDVPFGATVEQAAERLEVASPTVRKWLKEGLLKRVKGRKPAEIDPAASSSSTEP
jgi:hypothetical protein